MIDSYAFGRITIDGKSYTSDVLISPEGVRDGWWRRDGHELHPGDLADILAKDPEVLIVGTGAHRGMRVPDETRSFIAEKGVELIVKGTKKACEMYNVLSAGKRVVAALHLTC